MDFVTKDSGTRQTFDSGMVRDTQDGKLRFDLAFDGPLCWALFDGTPQAYLAQAAKEWYEHGGVNLAANVVREIARLEKCSVFVLMEQYAALMMRGAVKYTERNWMQATGEAELSRFTSSFCRHLKQYLNGEVDEDHKAAVMFNLNGAEYVRDRINHEIPF